MSFPPSSAGPGFPSGALLQVSIPASLGSVLEPVSPPARRLSPRSTLPKIPENKHIRVAVCMTGQLGRTEVRSKIDNLILANKRNADLHMFLVLSAGKTRFVNKATGDCEIAPASLEDAVMRFSEHIPTSVKEYKYKPYQVDIDKWPGYPEIGKVKEKRLQNHINQYRKFQICAKMISKQELKTRMKYHAVLRIRDNALVLQPFNILDRLLLLSHQVRNSTIPSVHGRGHPDLMDLPVITKECCSWSGVNDKVITTSAAPPLVFELIHHKQEQKSETGCRKKATSSAVVCTDATWMPLAV